MDQLLPRCHQFTSRRQHDLLWLFINWNFVLSRRSRHTRWNCDWSSDVCSSDLRMVRKRLWLILLLFLPLALLTCGRPESQRRVLRVGFVPSENVQQVAQNAQPIVEILEKKLAVEVQPFVATDYTGVVEALRADKLDIAFLSPASYVLAKNEANVKVVLKSHRKGLAHYYAAIITHADSGIRTLGDLRNRTFAFGDPLSTTGHVFPKKMFKI